jgi:hypothetical protein
MVQITVNDELARAIVQAGPAALLVDPAGRVVGQVTPIEHMGPIGITDEHLAKLDRLRAEDDGTRYTWPQVLEHLRALAPE